MSFCSLSVPSAPASRSWPSSSSRSPPTATPPPPSPRLRDVWRGHQYSANAAVCLTSLCVSSFNNLSSSSSPSKAAASNINNSHSSSNFSLGSLIRRSRPSPRASAGKKRERDKHNITHTKPTRGWSITLNSRPPSATFASESNERTLLNASDGITLV